MVSGTECVKESWVVLEDATRRRWAGISPSAPVTPLVRIPSALAEPWCAALFLHIDLRTIEPIPLAARVTLRE